MKKSLLLLLNLLMFVSLHSQGIKVFKKDGSIVNYNYIEIDSIVAYSFEESPIGPNGREAIDLGLSVKWANMNIGATSPEEYGDYFAWGETEPKEIFNWSNYKWCLNSDKKITKYCTSSAYGTVDNKTVLDPEDDAAHVNWGGAWRIPTRAEADELCEKCSWSWTKQNGVNGYKVTGLNGNSIFIPASGLYISDMLSLVSWTGYYWTASLSTGISNDADNLKFHQTASCCDKEGRKNGLSVRPVCQ